MLEIGDVVVSKFGNRWLCEAWERLAASGNVVYVLRNRPQEAPDAIGTVYSGPLPEWAERVERNGLRFWQRPTPKCECPAYAKAKGPYPSGFCPDCRMWYPGVTREQAIARGDIPPEHKNLELERPKPHQRSSRWPTRLLASNIWTQRLDARKGQADGKRFRK